MDQVKPVGSGFSRNRAGKTLHLYRLLESDLLADLETGTDRGPLGVILGTRV